MGIIATPAPIAINGAFEVDGGTVSGRGKARHGVSGFPEGLGEFAVPQNLHCTDVTSAGTSSCAPQCAQRRTTIRAMGTYPTGC